MFRKLNLLSCWRPGRRLLSGKAIILAFPRDRVTSLKLERTTHIFVNSTTFGWNFFEAKCEQHWRYSIVSGGATYISTLTICIVKIPDHNTLFVFCTFLPLQSWKSQYFSFCVCFLSSSFCIFLLLT